MGGKVFQAEGTEPAKAPKKKEEPREDKWEWHLVSEGGGGGAQNRRALWVKWKLTYCPNCTCLRIKRGSLKNRIFNKMRYKTTLLRDQNKDIRFYSEFKKKPPEALKQRSFRGRFTKKHTALERIDWKVESMEGRREEARTVIQPKWVIVSYTELLTQEMERGWIQDQILERESTTCWCTKQKEEENAG